MGEGLLRSSPADAGYSPTNSPRKRTSWAAASGLVLAATLSLLLTAAVWAPGQRSGGRWWRQGEICRARTGCWAVRRRHRASAAADRLQVGTAVDQRSSRACSHPSSTCPSPCAGCDLHASRVPPPSRVLEQATAALQQQPVLAPPARATQLPWQPLLRPAELRRGITGYGSGHSLQRVVAKLMAGQPIRAVMLGGSVTRGCCASGPSREGSYANRFFAFINQTWPHRRAQPLPARLRHARRAHRGAGPAPGWGRVRAAPRRPPAPLPPAPTRPRSGHQFDNAGIGGSSSALFSLCWERFVPAGTDLVVRGLAGSPVGPSGPHRALAGWIHCVAPTGWARVGLHRWRAVHPGRMAE